MKEKLILITHIYLSLFEKHKIKYRLEKLQTDDYFAIIWLDNSYYLKISYNDCTKAIRATFLNHFIGIEYVVVYGLSESDIKKAIEGEIEEVFNKRILGRFKEVKS